MSEIRYFEFQSKIPSQSYPLFTILGKVSSFEEEDGTGTGRNEVRIKLSRGDLGSQFTCQAENEAIDQPLSTSVQVDVNRKSLYFISFLPLGQ